ncbi:PTS transporter subunit EIIC [Spiroplasma sp. BIUS-1]|uniref:PTS transporter subunit EIIC n=1 Tax=Spiroplasma sp. BIUS-1 TaxID=216964 RepID=UPI001397E8AB|nr:PTS transporter subunit EIIC [Spiroplasma sp. BIUS-1]QHX36644.1 PTS system, glucose-specific IIBC component [Spiroplasma sp. BIUS-1]
MTSKQFNGFDVSWYTKNKMKSFLKKVGASFGFVIVLMPIFGIILSIGNAANLDVLKNIGNILFANIGLYFTIAIIIGFTSNKGSAVLAGILSYLVFNIFISSFIQNPDKSFFNIWFWKNLQSNAYLTKFFFGNIKTFNSGVVGGILIGVYVTYIFNRFKDTNLPKGLEFFSKEKLTIIISVFSSIIFASFFIIVWPVIGFTLTFIGSGVAKSPIGIDSFIFRTFQRMLIPFGSSLLWQSPMWYTQIGGNLVEYQQDLLIQYLIRTQELTPDLITNLLSITAKGNDQTSIIAIINNVLGDKDLNNVMNDWFTNTQEIFSKTGDQFIWIAVSNSKLITIDDCWNVGFRVSRFISGGYVNSIFTLPAISCAMLFLTPKGERRNKMGMYITAGLTAMLIGVTEPVEYLFCYTMPLFYFAIYCPFNGIIAALTSIFKVKIGTSFSTGIFDFTLSGIVPTVNGADTRIWIIPIIGLIAATIMFFATYFWFKYYNEKEKRVNIKARNLRDSLYLFLDEIGGIRNIKNYQINDNKLNISFKREPEVSKLFNTFDVIEKNNNEYKLQIKENKMEVIELTNYIISNRITKKGN